MRAKLDEKLKHRESLSNTPNNQQPTVIPDDKKEFMESVL